MRPKYLFGSLVSIPLLPLMYYQGKKIKESVPRLPEAINPSGYVDMGAKKTKNILLIGESTFAGVGVSTHEDGFCGTFSKELAHNINENIRWEVLAKSGYTAGKVGRELIPQINAKELDLIIIGLGGNDAFTLNSPKKWGRNVKKLISLIREKFPNTPIFLTNMPPIKEFPAFTKTIKLVVGNLVEILGETLDEIANDEKLVYYNDEVVTISTWTKRYNIENNISNFFSDGVHPSQLTYQTWAVDFAKFVTKTLKNENL